MFTLEFLAQIGVLVGTSAALYLVTQPSPLAWGDGGDDTGELRGMQRYSSYHRIRHYAAVHKKNSSHLATSKQT